jgi:hypothetical protein
MICYTLTRGSVVGWGTRLQPGRLLVRFPQRSFFFLFSHFTKSLWGWLSHKLQWIPGIFLGMRLKPTSPFGGLLYLKMKQVWTFSFPHGHKGVNSQNVEKLCLILPCSHSGIQDSLSMNWQSEISKKLFEMKLPYFILHGVYKCESQIL